MARGLLFLCVALACGRARGAEPEPQAPGSPLGIAISGGVSLGSWEAGFLYLYLEALKARPGAELRIVTGASAGSANAFLSAMASCLPTNPDPLADPGWKVWGSIGFHELFDAARATDEALFVKAPLEAAIERVRLTWNKGLPASCDVVFGASVTRVEPRQVLIKEGLSVPRSQETFLVRIQGRGMGRPPRLSNYVDPLALSPVPLLPFSDDEGAAATLHNYSQLRSVVLASGAFPLAFSPQRIEYCLSKPGRPGDVRCVKAEFSELFVDGGVFDNNPLRLAWDVGDQRLLRRSDGRFVWADARAPSEAVRHPAVRYLSLGPDAPAYPVAPVARRSRQDRGFLTGVLSMSGGMFDAARARELDELVQEHAELPERLRLAMSNLPKASELLSAFIGFFEQDFRLFDFYLGMYDAFVELEGTAAWKADPVDLDALQARAGPTAKNWAPFLCLLSMTEGGFERSRAQCDGPELANFRVLLQVSLDRLATRCRQVPNTPHALCTNAAKGLEGPRVPGVEALSVIERAPRKGEDDFDTFMRLLGAYHFEFKDLGLSAAQAGEGTLAIRHKLDEVVDAWAGAHVSVPERMLARSGARTALHEIAFSPPLHSEYLTLGSTLEVGASVVPFFWKPRWLQLTGALGVGSLQTLLTEPRPRVAFTLSMGPEFHLMPLSSSVLQPRLALRGGVQLGVFDGLGTSPCLAADPRDCTQGVVELVGIVTLFERLRAQVLWQTFPRLFGQPGFFHLQLGIGIQLL